MRVDDVHALRNLLASQWWALVLRGALAILFGAAMFAWPDVSIRVLALFFGVWFIGDGALTLLVAFDYGRKALRLSDAAVGIVGGLIAILATGVDAIALLAIIAVSAIARGILQIVLAVELGPAHGGAWVLSAVGAVTVVFAAALLAELPNGAIAALPLIAGFAVLLGVAYAAVGFWVERSDGASTPPELPPRRSSKG